MQYLYESHRDHTLILFLAILSSLSLIYASLRFPWAVCPLTPQLLLLFYRIQSLSDAQTLSTLFLIPLQYSKQLRQSSNQLRSSLDQ